MGRLSVNERLVAEMGASHAILAARLLRHLLLTGQTAVTVEETAAILRISLNSARRLIRSLFVAYHCRRENANRGDRTQRVDLSQFVEEEEIDRSIGDPDLIREIGSAFMPDPLKRPARQTTKAQKQGQQTPEVADDSETSKKVLSPNPDDRKDLEQTPNLARQKSLDTSSAACVQSVLHGENEHIRVSRKDPETLDHAKAFPQVEKPKKSAKGGESEGNHPKIFPGFCRLSISGDSSRPDSELTDPPKSDRIATFASELTSAWNAMAADSGLSRIQRLGEERLRKIATRYGSRPFRDQWKRALEAIPSSRFLTGEMPGRRKWKANFDWFISNDLNVTRILEGKYHPNGLAFLLNRDEDAIANPEFQFMAGPETNDRKATDEIDNDDDW